MYLYSCTFLWLNPWLVYYCITVKLHRNALFVEINHTVTFFLMFSAGTDYIPIPQGTRLTFREGNMNRPLCKEIQIIDDLLVEPLEEFQVGIVVEDVMSEGVQATFEPQNTIVKIIDDDHDFIIGFQQVHYKVNEGDGCVQVCVEVLAGQLRDTYSISIPLRTIDSSASGNLTIMYRCMYMPSDNSMLASKRKPGCMCMYCHSCSDSVLNSTNATHVYP